MQYINHWPELTKLALPEPVAQDFYRQLLEPFDSEEEAKELWEEMPSTIIILNSSESMSQLMKSDTWSDIEFALKYPEYTESLTMGYQVMLAIVNDAGNGIYLVIPPELSTVMSEKENELNNNH